MLYDLFAIDERTRANRAGQPDSDFTVVYHLLSLDTNEDMRIKVALEESDPDLPTSVGVWPNANWYEREAFDLFGILLVTLTSTDWCCRQHGKGMRCAKSILRVQQRWNPFPLMMPKLIR